MFFTDEDSKEFKDSDDKMYIVDFKKMKEKVKGAIDQKSVIEVVRKDLAIGVVLCTLAKRVFSRGKLESA